MGEQEERLSSRQRQTTHYFDDQAEIKKLWLGSHTASTVLPRHCAVGLLPVSIAPKQSRRTTL